MADGLNQVVLVGNLGADPELKMTGSGRAVLNMRLATSKSYLDANKVRQERTEWHSVKVWGPRAEGLGRFLSKGDRLTIVGEIRYTQWEGDDGTKRYGCEIIARDVVLGGGGNRRNDNGGGGRNEERTPPDDYPGDDDIPF
jgi:single-strand DNA-binding protein